MHYFDLPYHPYKLIGCKSKIPTRNNKKEIEKKAYIDRNYFSGKSYEE
jgi:hypothetical protein